MFMTTNRAALVLDDRYLSAVWARLTYKIPHTGRPETNLENPHRTADIPIRPKEIDKKKSSPSSPPCPAAT